MRRQFLAGLVAGLFLFGIGIARVVHATPFTIVDGEFNNGDWKSFIAYEGALTWPVIHSSWQVSSGGNPGAFRKMTQQQGQGTVSVFHYRNTPLYNPSIDGELASIDYEANVIGLGGPSATTFANGLILAQSGHWFWAPPSYAQFSRNTGGWRTTGVTGLLPSDFVERGGGGLLPDFSADGDSMWFGFFNNTTSPWFYTVPALTNGIDNWQVQLNSSGSAPVPEPATILLFGAGLVGLAGTRIKRKKK